MVRKIVRNSFQKYLTICNVKIKILSLFVKGELVLTPFVRSSVFGADLEYSIRSLMNFIFSRTSAIRNPTSRAPVVHVPAIAVLSNQIQLLLSAFPYKQHELKLLQFNCNRFLGMLEESAEWKARLLPSIYYIYQPSSFKKKLISIKTRAHSTKSRTTVHPF